MRLFFISKDASWQKYRSDVLQYLSAKYSIAVEILTSDSLKESLDGKSKVNYKVFKNYSKNKISIFPGAIAYIIKERPTVILAVNNISNITEYIAFIIAKLLGIKFIWWTHGYDHVIKKKSILFSLRLHIMLYYLKWADAVITFSEKGRIYLQNQHINPTKIFHAPNTLDTEKLLALAEEVQSVERNIICKGLNINPDNKYILFSGRLTKKKNIEYAVKIVKEVRKVINNVHFIIIGDGEARAEVETMISKENLSYISLLGEIYSDSDLAKWFSVSDVFLMPSYIGLAIVHAFCFGLPIVTEKSNDHGPELQYLHHGANGFISEKNNLEEIALNVIKLLECKELKNKLSRNAVNTIKNEANIEQMVKQMWAAISYAIK